MQYRRFPRIPELEISTLGFGLMRLPTRTEEGQKFIDTEAAEAALLAALDAGVNYLDTAYVYHGGASETFLGAAMERHGLRDRVLLATKSPVWAIREAGDWERILDEQLARLRTDRIDFYLLHALDAEGWETVGRLGGLEFLEREKARGRIGHLGFSFHDALPLFRTIVDAFGGWEFCQVQYNYMDADYQAGLAGIRHAAERELGVVVMEPLRGGALARPPREVREILARWPRPRMGAEWALRYVWERQEVVTALSGMGSVDQVLENAAYAEAARPNSLTRAELALLEEARAAYERRIRVPCTTCGYCLPCPSGVAIPEVFDLANAASMYDTLPDRARWYGAGYLEAGKGADRCVSCGECLPKCPRGIAIPERLAESHAYLTGSAR